MSIIQRVMEKKQGKKSAKEAAEAEADIHKPPILNLEAVDAADEKPVPTGQEKPSQQVVNRSSSNHRIVFDFEQMKKEGYLVPEDTENQQAEEYRRVKRPLLVNAFEGIAPIRNSNTILVTSSLPNEGKTFSALNLAISISLERKKTVLLVDADLQMAGLSKQSNLLEVAGLADVLNHDITDLREVIYGTNLGNLKIIPAGTRKKHSAELLASADMQNLVQDLSTRYQDRIIIIDSPPLLARSESAVLAKLVGQVVLVVEAENTMQSVVKEAVDQLEECEIVNMLLNKRHNRPGMSYHTGYYGY